MSDFIKRNFVIKNVTGTILVLLLALNVSVAHAKLSQIDTTKLNEAAQIFKLIDNETVTPKSDNYFQLVNKALRLSLPAAEAGNVLGLTIAGAMMILQTLPVLDKDKFSSAIKKSLKMLEQAAEKKSGKAHQIIIQLYLQITQTQNIPLAQIWFDRLENNSSIDKNERFKLIKDIQEQQKKLTLDIMNKIERTHILDADGAVRATDIAITYFHGVAGLRPDKNKALKLLNKAYEDLFHKLRGEVGSKFAKELNKKFMSWPILVQKSLQKNYTYLGYLLVTEGKTKKDKSDGIQILRTAAERGSTLAQEHLLKFTSDSANDDQFKQSAQDFGPAKIEISKRQGESNIDYNLRLSLVSFL